MKIINVVGARPNFIKVAPLMKEMRRYPQVLPVLIHTGQHYDATMSEQFFVELEISSPDFNLGVGSGTHAVQTAEVMRRLEPILEKERPDLVLVVGDVNSTPTYRASPLVGRARLPTDREHPFKTGRHEGCSNPSPHFGSTKQHQGGGYRYAKLTAGSRN